MIATSHRFWERRPLAFAHRGGSKEAPEGTMAAFESAVALGVDALEVDVHCTRDGHLVICHDPTVDRTTDGVGRIAALTLDQLRRLDFAAAFVPGRGPVRGLDPAAYPARGMGHGIVTLDQLLTRFPKVALNLDIKRTAPTVRPYERRLARLLDDHGRKDDVIVTSFNDAALLAFRLWSRAPTAFSVAGIAAFAALDRLRVTVPRLGAVALQVPRQAGGVSLVSPATLNRARRAGLAVHVWTIDDETEMGRLLDLGVDGIITDRPSVLIDLLQRRAAPHG